MYSGIVPDSVGFFANITLSTSSGLFEEFRQLEIRYKSEAAIPESSSAGRFKDNGTSTS